MKKIKDCLEALTGEMKRLSGEQLKMLEPFDDILELKGKKIEIIELTPPFNERQPRLINVMSEKGLADEVKLYSVHLKDNEVVYRCTEDSITENYRAFLFLTENFPSAPYVPKIEQQPEEEPKEQKELSFGQKLVGLDFNPSGDPKVLKAKQLCAELADLLHDHTKQSETSPLSSALFNHTVGEILNAQMNVVKVLTLKY